ncbi:hypothetical protein [Vibrio sp. WXL210]|uniref:hypothetical protein n=1 Tax=Vibrio sp. WXL210 TaxID=3450709 RepID=UPI003EC64401
MKSSLFGYRLIQLFGFFLCFMPFMFVQAYFWPESTSATVDLGEGNFTEHLMFWLSCVCILAIGFNIFHKASLVNFSDDSVSIRGFNRDLAINWSQVKGVRKIPFVSPPMYRISFLNNQAKPAYFSMSTTSSWEISTPWALFSGDKSGVLKYVRQKVNEAKIT